MDIFGAARFANEAERASSSALSSWTRRAALAANIVTGAIRSAALAERVALTEKQAVLSRQVARDAQRRYELGSASQSEALDADRDAANLEASLPGCTPNGSPSATRWPCCWAARPTRRRPTWPSAR